MKKKTISLVLCLAMLMTTLACCVTANAATTEEGVGYNRTTSVSGPDDFTWDNASVYFLLTDRFYNGNTSNDHSYGRATNTDGSAIAGWDSAPGTFHGGDFAGITQKINEGYFDDLGINAIWLSAPYEQIHGWVTPGDGLDFAHYSYHGYYVLDYTEPDLNFGTRAEFQTMVDTAHSHGIRVIMDVVMNHAGYNTLADMKEYGFGTITDNAAAESFIHRITNVNGMHDIIDYKSSTSDWGKWWGTSWIRSGLPGYQEGSGSDTEQCLAGLPDFRTESTASVSIPTFLQSKWQKEGTYNKKISKYGSSGTVSDYIVKWLSEWVSTYGVDGFRCDTAKHVEYASWKKLKTSCVQALRTWRQNNPTKVGADWDEDFWMTGECWGHNLAKSPYYTEGGFDSMINFAFSGSGVPAISSIDGTYRNYAETINSQADFNALTYISSHDSNLARNDLMYQGSAFQLMPGGIQIYYGDETNRPLVSGMSFDGNGGSGHSLRSDMNWNSMNTAMLSHWQKVGKFRSNHVAVGAGDHQTISAYNASTGYAFARTYDDGETTDGIIAVIGAPANQPIAVNVSSIWSNGKTLTNAYDGSTAVVSDGKVTFNSGANGTILIEGPQPTISMNLKGSYSFYDSETVTASLRGADFATVSINGGTPFTVTNGQTFSIGEGIAVGTVFTVEMSATNNTETIEKSFSFKKKDPDEVISIYFDNTKYNWSTVNAYIYDENVTPKLENAAWPGEAMTYDSTTGLYVMEVPDELINGNVIFNAGKDSSNRYPADQAKGLEINETSMIFSYGNTWEIYDGQTAEPTDPVDPSSVVTVYYDNSNTNYNPPYIYYWRSSTDSSDITWPGVPMQKYKDNVYKMTFPAENDRCIFSNNGGSKTDNLTIPGKNYIYQNNTWTAYADAEQPTTVPVETTTSPVEPTTSEPPIESRDVLVGDANLDGAVTVSDVTAIQRHLIETDVLTGDALVAADTDKSGDVTIADATAIQYYLVEETRQAADCGTTVTITPEQPATTQPTTAAPTTEPTTEPTTAPAKNYIYFYSTSWNPVKAYFWSDDNLNMMNWNDAITCDNLGNGVHRVEVLDGATWVIFNNNGGNGANQTGNIHIEGYNKIYRDGSWQDYNG